MTDASLRVGCTHVLRRTVHASLIFITNEPLPRAKKTRVDKSTRI